MNPIKGYIAQENLTWTIECKDAVVKAAQLQHRVPCFGYAFLERELPEWPASSNGSDSEAAARRSSHAQSSSSSSGSSNSSKEQQLPDAGGAARRRKVVILGDTTNSKCIIPWGLGADLLSHEATFTRGMEERAWVSQHSTGWMAGQCARAMRARLLVLTHFSARFEGAPRNMGRFRSAEDMLWSEAADEFGSEALLLAEDLFSVHIPVSQQQQMGFFSQI